MGDEDLRQCSLSGRKGWEATGSRASCDRDRKGAEIWAAVTDLCPFAPCREVPGERAGSPSNGQRGRVYLVSGKTKHFS